MEAQGVEHDVRRFGLALAILIVSAYPGVFLGTAAFFFRDYGYFGFPIGRHVEESFRQGELPFWNPLSNCGIPFLAQWNTMVLYPGTWLAALVGMERGMGWFCLFHQWLAGVGMFILARKWSGSGWGGWIGGIGFALGGLTQTSLMWPNNIAALGWMPWVIRLGEEGRECGGRTWGKWVMAGTAQMLTGAPEVILLTWVLLSVLVLFGESRVSFGLRASRFLASVLAISGLAACQLLPFLELLHYSQRNAGYAGDDWSMPPTGWANFLVPMFRCFSKYFGVPGQYGQFWTASYYSGAFCVFLALVSVCLEPRRKNLRLFGVLAVCAMVVALGDAGYLFAWIRWLLPSVGMLRYPVKAVTLVCFIVPLLAACGTGSLLRSSGDAKRRWVLMGAILIVEMLFIVGITLFGEAHPVKQGFDLPVLANGMWRLVFLMAGGACLACVAKPGREGGVRGLLAAGTGMVFALILDLRTHAPEMNPTVNPAVYRKEVFALSGVTHAMTNGRVMLAPQAFLQAQRAVVKSPEADFLISRRILLSNCNLLDSIPKVDGLFSLYLRDIDWINDQLLYSRPEIPREREPLLDFLGVSAFSEFVDGKPEWVWRTGALPMVTIGQAPRFDSIEEIRRKMVSGDFKPATEVLLELQDQKSVKSGRVADSKVRNLKTRSQRLEFATESSSPALVVIANAWHPSWKAYADGIPLRLLKANLGFQAFEVPAGIHQVSVVFRPASFWLGLCITVGSAAGVLIFWFRTKLVSASS